MSMWKKSIWKKRPYIILNFGIGNGVVMSMWKKSIWKRKKKTYRKERGHILTLALEIMLYRVKSMWEKSIWKRKDHIEKKEAIF